MNTLTEMGYQDITSWLGSGVYVLCYQGKVIYVGSSKEPLSRVCHWARSMTFDEVYLLKCSRKEMQAEERRLIAKFRPRLNSKDNPAYHLMLDLTEKAKT